MSIQLFVPGLRVGIRRASPNSSHHPPCRRYRVLLQQLGELHLQGYLYKGLIFCPMELRTLLFNAIFSEHGTTGVREAVVSAQLFEAGQLEIDFETVSDEGGSHPIPGWFFDPYDPEFEGVVLNSISDDVKYDEIFPGHPLTELRRVFEKVRGTAVVEALYR